MDVLQIGSIAILLKWVLLAAAVVMGIIIIRIWMFRTLDSRIGKRIFDLLINSLFIGFFAWKGSLLVLEPGLIMRSPMSLLYFTGGRDGLVIAIICAIIYFLIKAVKMDINKHLALQTLFIFGSAVLGIYHLFFAFFLQGDVVFHSFIGIAALLASIFNRMLQTRKKMLSFAILFSFGYEIFSLALVHSEGQILFFTSDQWFFILVILFSLYSLEKENTENKKVETKDE